MLEGDKLAETPQGEAKWNAQDWRSYLLALAHNSHENNYCLPYQNFPKEIELSAAWYETFGAMRRLTAADGRERWGLIGATQTRDRVFISQTFVRAEKDPYVIHGSDIQVAINRARDKELCYCVGDIHTHPQERRDFRQWLSGEHEAPNEFSALDLYALLTSMNPLSVMFLVGPTEYRLACRSEGTLHFPVILDQESFASLWSERARNKATSNLAIAQQYRLVLYGGNSEETMQRILF